MSPPLTPAPSSWTPGRAACWRRNRSPCVVATARFRRVKIYTKTGDAGETGLFGGGRVPKDDLRVAAYGAVDETNAAVGTVLAQAPEAFESTLLQTIQRTLFTIGAELATPKREKLAQAVGDADVAALEAAIDKHEATLPPLKNFILPNGTAKASAFHVA